MGDAPFSDGDRYRNDPRSRWSSTTLTGGNGTVTREPIPPPATARFPNRTPPTGCAACPRLSTRSPGLGTAPAIAAIGVTSPGQHPCLLPPPTARRSIRRSLGPTRAPASRRRPSMPASPRPSARHGGARQWASMPATWPRAWRGWRRRNRTSGRRRRRCFLPKDWVIGQLTGAYVLGPGQPDRRGGAGRRLHRGPFRPDRRRTGSPAGAARPRRPSRAMPSCRAPAARCRWPPGSWTHGRRCSAWVSGPRATRCIFPAPARSPVSSRQP